MERSVENIQSFLLDVILNYVGKPWVTKFSETDCDGDKYFTIINNEKNNSVLQKYKNT